MPPVRQNAFWYHRTGGHTPTAHTHRNVQFYCLAMPTSNVQEFQSKSMSNGARRLLAWKKGVEWTSVVRE